MSIPNIGPEHFDDGDSNGADGPRRGNPAPVLRGEPLTDDVTAASARASTVTHRFGGVRHALTRPDGQARRDLPPFGEGDSNARD